METAYRINEHGVVLNPTIIFEYCSPKFLAWDRYLIKMGKCKNGLWNFGYNLSGSSSPVSCGKWKTSEECEKYALKFLIQFFSDDYNENKLGSQICYNNAKKSFNSFLERKINLNVNLAKELNFNNSFQLSIF